MMDASGKYLLFVADCALAVFPHDRFLKFLHYLLSVEFPKYVPVLNSFLKEKEELGI
jgi:hypothetical protein